MRWIVAFNLPTRTWSSGGRAEEYERPHWDLYEVEALGRDEAEKRGRALRARQRGIAGVQAKLLASLIADHRLCHAPGHEWIEVTQEEAATAARLAQKGLVRLLDVDPRRLRLTLSAFNDFGSALADAAGANPGT